MTTITIGKYKHNESTDTHIKINLSTRYNKFENKLI